MSSINLSKLCMEDDDPTMNEIVRCNHGFVIRLKTSWTSSNPGRRYWSCPYYGGPRSCDFWCWRDKEDIDPRSKFVISKLIEKLGELEYLVESSQRSVNKYSEEVVDKPGDFKAVDNCADMKLELKKLEQEVEKLKEKENKWRRTRENVLFFVVIFCCVVFIAISYLFGLIYMRKGSMKLP